MTLCHLPCCGQGGRSCQGNSYAFLEYELPSGQGERASAWTGPAPPFTLPLCLSFLRLPTCILPSEGTSQNRTQCPLLLHLPVLQPLGPRPKAQVHAGCGHLLGPGLHPLATFPILDIQVSIPGDSASSHEPSQSPRRFSEQVSSAAAIGCLELGIMQRCMQQWSVGLWWQQPWRPWDEDPETWKQPQAQ